MTPSSGERVSVVIPTYNRAGPLRRAVESVAAQTVRPLEVVVVDDGSTDHTEAVIDDLPGPVRYIRQENQGVSAARNRGMTAAEGELIAFLDADDEWEPEMLKTQLAVLDALPFVDWCVTNLRIVDVNGDSGPVLHDLEQAVPVFDVMNASLQEWFGRYLEKTQVGAAGQTVDVYHGDAFEMLFFGNFAFPSGTMIRRSVMETAGYFNTELRRAVDTEYFHRLAAHRHPIAVIMRPLFRYRMGGEDALTAPPNTVELIGNAIRSVDTAVALRGELTREERRAYRRGRELLLLRKAYTHITDLDTAAARATLRKYREGGGALTPTAVGLMLASWIPRNLLRVGGAVKRRLKP